MNTTPMTVSAPSAILGAASELFAMNGYQRTSMSDIAARAGISVGTVYNSFSSKAELLLEVFRAYDRRQADRTRDAVGAARIAGVSETPGLFAAATHGYLQGVWRERALSRLFTSVSTTDIAPEAVVSLQSTWLERNARVLGITAGTAQGDATLATISGAIGGWVRGVHERSDDDDANAFISEASRLASVLAHTLAPNTSARAARRSKTSLPRPTA